MNPELELIDFLSLLENEEKREQLFAFLQTARKIKLKTEIKNALLNLPSLMQSLYYELPRDKYRFSHAITIFLMACEKHFDLVEIKSTELLLTDRNTKNKLCAFINTLYLLSCSASYEQAKKQFEKNTDYNFEECTKYINQIFYKYSKVLVVRIDLYYQANIEADFERLKSDFRKLQNNARHNQDILFGLIGYVFKIEYGVKKGLHAHVLMFFNGQIRNYHADVFIAQQIGEYWKDTITEGDGAYHNCNANKSKYNHLALGLIQYSDEQKRNNLKYIINYLCKKQTQYIKPITNPNAKLITKGFISTNTIKLGRRREKEYEIVDGVKYYNSGSVLEEF